jgi:hypothetical protein
MKQARGSRARRKTQRRSKRNWKKKERGWRLLRRS